MFAHLSDYPEFAGKINLFVALAPIASIVHIESLILEASAYIPQEIFYPFGLYDFLPYMNIPTLIYEFCDKVKTVCPLILELLADKNTTVDNLERLPIIMAHEPGGTSVRNMAKYEQGIHAKASSMCKYDYGEKENMEIYHQPTAPCYDLGAIKTPIAWWVGTDDRLANPTDVAWLRT